MSIYKPGDESSENTAPWALKRLMTETERNVRSSQQQRADDLKATGICPTCRDFEIGGIYPATESRALYEDDLVLCMLEAYPRTPGHTILLLKPHYEDLSEVSLETSFRVLALLHKVIAVLKEVLRAQKVYLCTMCDGKRNHFHWQLLPRQSDDPVMGSKVFIQPRGMLVEQPEVIAKLRHRLVAKP
jgi:diadenosine tetraphosphate (Ap4A) HIT family hydrolase